MLISVKKTKYAKCKKIGKKNAIAKTSYEM